MEELNGFYHIKLSDEEMSDLYQKDCGDSHGCLMNEYLVVENSDEEIVDKLKWCGNHFVSVPYKVISTKYYGTIKPRNIYQQLAIDMLYDQNVTVKLLTGRFGSGKTYLMCSAAVDLLEKGKYDKIVCVRNNIEVKDSKPIGYLPGSYQDKLLPFMMPLAEKLGGIDALELLISQGRIEPVHLGFIRGRDIKNSIVMCSEAENMTKEHMRLLVSRIGEGSSLWIDGDPVQTDARVFEINNGIRCIVEKLRGNKLFGHVNLLISERSETASLADLFD